MELFAFDQLYLQRLREGDPPTEQHFVSYFGQLLGIMLRARMLSPEVIDDVRQETFSRVFAALRREGGIQQPERFGAFVNSVCKNVLRENTRKWQKSRPLEEGDLEPGYKIVDLERELISQETKRRVADILKEMAERDRALLRAIFLEEQDKDEVCRHFGVDRDYLRVRLHRAKERFRAVYERQPGPAASASAKRAR